MTQCDSSRPVQPAGRRTRIAAALVVLLVLAVAARADEPYARSREYDLQHARISLRFDLEHRKLLGEVTHRVVALRDSVARIEFDSVDLVIGSVTIGGRPVKFETTATKLLIPLDPPARRGQAYEITVRYEGRPKRGLYFVLPDKNYPRRPIQIWTQGENEDTRYYIPIYDYPNDRAATEMLLTVPAGWETVSNGRLVGTTDAGGGLKTWHWRQDVPHSTYLISLVAGEFDRVEETWRSKPVTYYVPRGASERISSTFPRTREMLDFMSDTLGVPYPWEKYAQVAVDDFVEGGMENISATTLESRSLIPPQLVVEQRVRSDDLLSHELAHQWFGDLVTCKDWGHLWLNEGFATAFEMFWEERYYGGDEFAYTVWRKGNDWMRQHRLFGVPILTHNFTDTTQYYGNNYDKAGLVVVMLRNELGPADFYRGLRHYLETYRAQNVVTADLAKAIEEATGRNVDRFFDQWIYRAGAPKFEVSYAYDEAAKQVKLDVRQTQKLEGDVGFFQVPIEVEITSPAGRKTFPIVVSKAAESLTFAVDDRPLLVLFDRGDKILKSIEFKKSWQEWVYQLRNALTVPDRADAAVALREFRENDAVLAALGAAAQLDPFWGVRAEAFQSLGRLGGQVARDKILEALDGQNPWTKQIAIEQLENFRDDAVVAGRLEKIFREDSALRVREAALQALVVVKAKNAYDLLMAATRMDSPGDRLRAVAMFSLGILGDENATPLALEWSAPGKPFEVRPSAIRALGRLDRKNKETTKRLIGYLQERIPDVRRAAIVALSERGDADAAGPIEELANSGELYDPLQKLAETVVKSLRTPMTASPPAVSSVPPAMPPPTSPEVRLALERLEREVNALKERVKKLEERFGSKKE